MTRAAAVSSPGLSGVRLGKLPGKVMPFCVAGSASSGTGAGGGETGNLLAGMETRPPCARPSPSEPRLCDPPRGKLGATRTSAQVRLSGASPTETDRGHRG